MCEKLVLTLSANPRLLLITFQDCKFAGVICAKLPDFLAEAFEKVRQRHGCKRSPSGALYIFGTLLYVAHIPERLAPGRFDYIGASHQLFHACVLFAALLHLVALRRSYLFWHVVETTSGEAGRQAVCRALHFP